MTEADRPPPIDARLRTPLKVVAVIIGYVIYRILLGDDTDHMTGPLLVAAGFTAIAYVLVNRWTTRPADLSGLIQVGTAILGLGLLSVGAVLQIT